jgi:hypothetical protein
MISASPERIAVAAFITLIMPDEHTISTAYPFTVWGIPVLKAA